MGVVLTLLAKNWRLIGIGLLAALLALQTGRISRLKTDLATAKVALVDPVTGKRWRDEAIRDAVDLKTCRTNYAGEKAANDTLSAANVAKAAEDAASLARAAQALQAAESGILARDRLIDALKLPLAAGDACTQAAEIDARFLRGLQ